jgi:hypothetical protein
MPPYSACASYKQVALLIPYSRQRSGTGTPLSPWFRIATICGSVNLDLLAAPDFGSFSSPAIINAGEVQFSSRLFLGMISGQPALRGFRNSA